MSRSTTEISLKLRGDGSARLTKLKAAKRDLMVLGAIVHESIVPYSTTRKIGWNGVDFMGSPAPLLQSSFDHYKVDHKFGAIYRHVAAALTVLGLESTKVELITDHVVKRLESIKATSTSSTAPRPASAPTSTRAPTPRSWRW